MITALLLSCLILVPMLLLWILAPTMKARGQRADSDEDKIAASLAGFLLGLFALFVPLFGLVVNRCTRE